MNKIMSVLEFGADPSGKVNTTKEIQQTIDAVYLAGGGTVEVPEGRYLIGSIRLRSRITLHLQQNAVLLGSRNPEDYLCIENDEIEPLDEYEKGLTWLPGDPRDLPSGTPGAPALPDRTKDFMHNPLSRWNCGMIRAIHAVHVAIIGEKGSLIDGQDCYDPIGEEGYRGPHAINMHFCSDLTFKGYDIRNSSNWAHCLFTCHNIKADDIRVYAGHDGFHVRNCDNIVVKNSEFYTGDDAIAGFDDIDMLVENCILNTACSAFRLGGTHILIKNSKMCGPAKYLFRGSLTREEMAAGKPSEELTPEIMARMQADGAVTGTTHRFDMLSAFTYFADFNYPIREVPGDIVIEDCVVENVDRFIHYNYSGNEIWQNNKPLHDITFRGVKGSGILMPLTLYGDADNKVIADFEDCDLSFPADIEEMPFMQLAHYDHIRLKNVKVTKKGDAPFIRRWSEEEDLVLENMTYVDAETGAEKDLTVEKAEKAFYTKAI